MRYPENAGRPRPSSPYERPLTAPEPRKDRERYRVQDITDPTMPTVTEMVGDSVEYVGGNMLRFVHSDGTVTVLAMKDGWNLTVEPNED